MVEAAMIVWLPISELAVEYNRTPRLMRIWCANGFLIELGFRVRRDETGHWIVGVPEPVYQTFKQKAEIAETSI